MLIYVTILILFMLFQGRSLRATWCPRAPRWGPCCPVYVSLIWQQKKL